LPSYTSTVLGTVVVAVGGAEVTRMANAKWNTDHPKLKQHKVGSVMSPVLGGFALGLFLFAFGIANEHLASMFCLLIVVASLLVNGKNLFDLLTTLSK